MDFKALLAQGSDLVSKVQADPAKYKAALDGALEAYSAAREFMGKLSTGDVVAAQAMLSDLADVHATRQALAGVVAQIENDGHAITLQDVAEGVGAVMKAGILVAKIAL